MFEKGRFVTCIPKFDFRFGITTSKGVYVVEDDDVWCDKNDNRCEKDAPDATHGMIVRVVRHDHNDYNGNLFFISEADQGCFEDVTEIVKNEIRDKELEVCNWKKTSAFGFAILKNSLGKYRFCYNDYIDSSAYLLGEVGTRYVSRLLLPVTMNKQFNRKTIIFTTIVDGREISDTTKKIRDVIRSQVLSQKKLTLTIGLCDSRNYDNFLANIDELKNGFEQYKVNDDYCLDIFSYQHRIDMFVRNNNGRTDIVAFANSNTYESFNRIMLAIYDYMSVDIDHDIFQAVFESDEEKYVQALTLHMKEWIVEIVKDNFEKKFEVFEENLDKISIEPLQNSIRSLERDLDSMYKAVAQKNRTLKRKRMELFYKENHVSKGENEFVNYLRDMGENLISADLDNEEYMKFDVLARMSVWDDDIYNIIRKSDSNFDELDDAHKQLLDDIFLNRSIYLLIEQPFKLYLDTSRHDRGAMRASFDTCPTRGMPHPHIYEYDCWGTHMSAINKYVEQNDYMQAFAQCVACISGITWDDSAVSSRFINNLDNYEDIPCLLVKETNEYLTIHEYVTNYNNSGKEWKL